MINVDNKNSYFRVLFEFNIKNKNVNVESEKLKLKEKIDILLTKNKCK
jgi:hypothetical protein